MAAFDMDAYLNRKLGSFAPEKIDAIMKAKEAKIAGLQQFRDAIAAQDPAGAMREQAIRDGRTTGEFVSDVGLSALQGLDSLAKLPAMVYDKATTGDFYGPETQAISAMSDEREKLKSALSQAKSQEKMLVAKATGDASKAAAEDLIGPGVIADTAGVAAEFGSSFWESLKDPEALPEFIAQQVAQMGVMGKVGRGAELAAQSAAKLAPKIAATAVGKKVLENSATAGAVGFGAGLQGVDTGSDTMQRLMSMPDAVWAQNPEFIQLAQTMTPAEAKQEIASRIAGEATLKAAGASLASSMLPGGNALEKALVGKQKGSFASVVPQAFRGEAVQEGLEEGSGAYIANKGVQEVNPNQGSLEGVGAAAGQGAFLGGALGGGVSALKVQGINVAKAEEAKAKLSADFQEAAKTGDTSAYLDPKSKTYDPATAVGVLFKNSQLDTATEESKQTNLQKATEIVDSLTTQRDQVATLLAGGVEAQVAEQQQGLKAVEEKIAQTDPADTQQLANLNELVTMYNEEIAAVTANPKPANVLQGELDVLDRHIKNSSKVLSELSLAVQPKIDAAELDKQVALADSTVDVADTQAVEQSRKAVDTVLNLAMASSSKLTAQAATQLANNTANSLTDDQRSYLRSFSEAQVAVNQLKTLGTVSEEIYVGNPKTNMKGIADYKKEMATSLAAGNQKAASKSLNLLNSFVEDHNNKAAAAQEAFAAFNKDGVKRRLVSEGQGVWKVEEGFWSDEKARAKNGGLNISGNATKLVANIPLEADALSKVATELTAAFNLKFGASPTVAPSPVPAAQATASPTPAAPTGSAAPVRDFYVGKTIESLFPGTEEKYRILEGNAQSAVSNSNANKKSDLESRDLRNQYETLRAKKDKTTDDLLDLAALGDEMNLISLKNNPRGELASFREDLQGELESFDEQDAAYVAKRKPVVTGLLEQLKAFEQRAKASVAATGSAANVSSKSFTLKDGGTASITAEPSPKAFSSMVRMEHGEPITLTAKDQDGKLLGRLTYMPKGGPIDVMVEASERRRGVGSALYDALEATGAKLMEPESGVIISDEARALRDSRKKRVDSATSSLPPKNNVSVSTAEVEPRPESSSEPVVATDSTEEQIQGVLSVLQDKSPEGTTYSSRKNLLADFFTQVAGSAKAATLKPLASTKDFVSKLVSGELNPQDFMKDIPTLSGKQVDVLNLFYKAQTRWNQSIRSALENKGDPKYNYKNLMHFFQFNNPVDGKLDLDENTKSAISLAVFNYIADNAGGRGIATLKQINNFLGKDEDAPISASYALLAKAGTIQSSIINELGSTAFMALGLKPNPDAPKDIESRLKDVLGAHALHALLSEKGLMERTEVKATDLEFGKGDSKKDISLVFYRFKRNPDTKGISNAFGEEIYNTTKGSGMVLQKVFGVEGKTSLPFFKPQKFVQNKAKNAQTNVPKSVKRALQKENDTPYELRQDMHTLYAKVGFDTFLEFVGLPELDPDKTHIENRLTYEAQRDQAERALDTYATFVENDLALQDDGIESPFYFTHELWKNHRVGLVGNGINPQMTKPHRYLVSQPAWKTTIKTADTQAVAKFLMHVGETFGFSGTDAQIIAAVEARRKDPVFIKAMTALAKSQESTQELTQEDRDALVAGVKLGKENLQSLDGMFALSQLDKATASRSETFTVQMNTGVDGVSNGVIFSHWLLGAASSVKGLFSVLNKGGIYQLGSEHKDYSVWHAQEGNLDMYEKATDDMNKWLLPILDALPNGQELKTALYAVTRPLFDKDRVTKDGRKFAKGVVPPIIFGSTFENAVADLGGHFLESINSGFEKLVGKSQQELNTYVTSLNVLIAHGNPRADLWPVGKPLREYLDTPLGKQQKAAILEAFMSTLGESMEQAITDAYAPLRERQSALSTTGKLAFGLFDAVFKGKQEALKNRGEVERNTIGKPIHDINKNQENQIREELSALRPIMHSLFSKRDNDLDSGLMLSKVETLVSDSDLYDSQTKFGSEIPGSKGVTSLRTRGRVLGDVAPGASVGTAVTHSTDSTVSNSGELSPSLNMHDERVAGVGQIAEIAKTMNRRTYLNIVEYSPMEEAYQTLVRTVTELHRLSQQKGALPVEAQDKLVDLLGPMAWKMREDFGRVPTLAETMTAILQKAKDDAYKADMLKLTAAAQVSVVNQYAYEGQGYEVTEKDREYTANLITQLVREVPAEVKADIDALGRFLKIAEARRILRLRTAKNNQAQQDSQPTGKTYKRQQLEEEGNEAEPTLDASTEETVTFDPTKTSGVLTIPAVQAMQLLESMSLDTEVDTALQDQAKKILEQMISKGASLKQAVTSLIATADVPGVIQSLASKFSDLNPSAWGELGTPVLNSNTTLVKAFEARGNLTAAEAIKLVEAELLKQEPTGYNAFQRKMLRVITKLVSPDLRIQYVTPATSANMVQADGGTSVRGWYSLKGTSEAIYVLSPDYKQSGITPELLVHELLHAALAWVIENESKGGNTQASYLVKELDTLLHLARIQAKQDGKLKKFGNAFENIHELVSWGLTNEAFQNEVLNKVRMESRTKGNPLVSGMRVFIDTITNFLFAKPSMSDVSGLGILLSNVSGLFAEAARIKAEKAAAVKNITLAMGADPLNEAMKLSTQSIHDALANSSTDPVFSDHLRELLGNIVEKLHGPFESFKALVQQNQALSITDVYTKAKDTGIMPFASDALAAGFPINDQEAFALEQVEATMRAALEDNEGQSSVAYNELSRLYTEAYNRFKKEDFTNRPDEKALVDFAFDVKAGASKKSDYLSRFAALGLAHQGFNKMLQIDSAIDMRQLSDIKTFADKLQYVFSKVLNYLNGKLTRTYDGQRADAKLTALVEQLVHIEAKKRRTIAANKVRSDSVTDQLEEGIRIKAEQARAKIGDIAQSDFFQKSNNAFVKAASSIVTVIARDRAEQLMETLSRYRDANFREKQGLIAGLITDIRGLPVLFQTLLRASKNNEKNRKFIITEIGKSVMNSFTAENIEAFKTDTKSITEVFLRTDVSALLDKFSLADMQNMLSDSTQLASAVAGLEKQLGQFTRYQHYFIKASKDLAYYMAKGEVRGQHLMMNARNIALMSDTAYAGRLTEAEATIAEGIIDQLVSLKALQYTAQTSRIKASRIFEKELARTDKGNGVEMVLRMHQSLQKQSKERLFKGSEALMMKGYTSEIYNPNIDVKVETLENGKELLAMGYSLGDRVQADPKDLDQTDKFIYVMRDGGLNPRLSGIMSLTGMRSKGTREFMGNRNDRLTFEAKKQAAIREMFNPDPTYSPADVKLTFAAPILNAQGGNSGYRYLMQERTKNEILERDNRFEKVLGTMAGSIVDKETVKTQNHTGVEALKAQYDAEFAERSVSYVEVGPNSPDAELREIYRLLPDVTKESIKQVWDREGMMVRVDLLDINFGYRKLSLSDIFEKEDRNTFEDGFVLFTEIALQKYAVFKNLARERKGLPPLDVEKYGKRAAMVVRKNERIWQEIVHEMKDIIVVKTGTVMLGNIASNLSLLFMNGVSFSDIIKHHRVAMKAATAYQKDSAELFQLKQQVETGFVQGNEVEVRKQIIRLEDHLARNPVKPLIDAGLMPTIVEDVAADDDIYSYKSQFVRAADKYTSKLNPTVRAIGEVAYMKHDTKLYRGLSHITQLSDFVARYTLYQHLTTKKVPMSSTDAIQEASDSFVNYDIPMHRGMQYLDDMGVMMFTKYFMRIQRVLLKLTREHPTRVLGTVLMNNYFDLMPMITDSSFLNHVGNNPFGVGALGLPSTLDELATVNAGLELFK